MTKQTTNRRFKVEILILSFVLVTIFTAISLLAAWARDEGQIDEQSGAFQNFLADSFYFFRLPTHELFWDSISENASTLFLPSLLFNIVFWSILIERLVAVTMRSKK